MPESLFIEFGSRRRVHCLRFGQGPQLLIALHGFGDSGAIFQNLAPELSGAFVIYAPDLPYHGQTEWPFPRYAAADISELVETILAREGRHSCYFLGFSFGGRILLSMFPQLADKALGFFLVAPDGLGTRGMGFPLLVPRLLRYLWAPLLHRPGALLWLAGRLNRLGIIPSIQFNWLRFFLSDPGRRRCVIHSWFSLDSFRVFPRQLRERAGAVTVPLHFIVGSRDELIPLRRVRRIASRIPNASVLVLPGGHYSLVNRRLARELLQNRSV